MREPNTYLGRVRIGVAGAGRMGSVHIRLLNELKGLFNFIGVYDPIKGRADVAEKYGGFAFDNFEKMLENVDAIVLSCPTSMHKEMALRAAEKGVHVLVEKPAAQNCADAEAMYEVFNKKNLKLTVNHVERFNPIVRTISDLADSLDIRQPQADADWHIENPRYGESTKFSNNCGYCSIAYELFYHGIRNRGR